MSECPKCGGELDREDCDYCDGCGHLREGAGNWSMLIVCPDCGGSGHQRVCLDCHEIVRED